MTGTPSTQRAKNREDFIRRLFAVAISIGLTTTLARMDWVRSGTWPDAKDWDQLGILGTGLILTILSWDGYVASIQAKPLEGDWSWRFCIDISLVLIYLLFMLTTHASHFWPFILAATFVLYVLWDFITVREYVGSYDAGLKLSVPVGRNKATILHVFQIYYRGFRGCQNTSQGPAITLSWAIFFVIFAGVYHSQQITTLLGCAAASAGLILYRGDKCKNRYGDPKKFSISKHFFRVAVIFVVLELSFVTLKWYLALPERQTN